MKFVQFVDKLNGLVGGFAAWLVIPLMLVVLFEVTARRFFNAPTTWAYDTLWMLYSMNFLLGGAFTLLRKGHIRIDIIQDTFSPRVKLIFDTLIYGIVFLVPCVILTWSSANYAWESWSMGENLSTTSWIFPAGPIKSILPLAFFLLGLQSVGEIVRNLNALCQKVEL